MPGARVRDIDQKRMYQGTVMPSRENKAKNKKRSQGRQEAEIQTKAKDF